MNIDIHSYLTRDGLHKARIRYTSPQSGVELLQRTGDCTSIEDLFFQVNRIVRSIHMAYSKKYG